jgi:hypothetical protein
MSEAPTSLAVATLLGDGRYRFKPVPEPHHQSAIDALVGPADARNDGFSALLLPDTAAASVAVIIDGAPVGWLTADDAAVLIPALTAGNLHAAQCGARVTPPRTRRGNERPGMVALDIAKPIQFGDARVVALDEDVSAPAVSQPLEAEPEPLDARQTAPLPSIARRQPHEAERQSRRRRKLAGTIIVVVVLVLTIVAWRLQQSGPT